MKNPVLGKSQKMSKKRLIFAFPFFQEPYFSLRNFHKFQKNRQKNVVFWPSRPRRHLFQFFCCVFMHHSNRSQFTRKSFQKEKRRFFQLFVILDISPRRHSNLTSLLQTGICFSRGAPPPALPHSPLGS